MEALGSCIFQIQDAGIFKFITLNCAHTLNVTCLWVLLPLLLELSQSHGNNNKS